MHATIIGIDLAKRSFQLHGARADGSVAFRKKLNRDRVLGMARGEGRRSWLPSADTETYTLVGLSFPPGRAGPAHG